LLCSNNSLSLAGDSQLIPPRIRIKSFCGKRENLAITTVKKKRVEEKRYNKKGEKIEGKIHAPAPLTVHKFIAKKREKLVRKYCKAGSKF
jgi:hypothetical protein